MITSDGTRVRRTIALLWDVGLAGVCFPPDFTQWPHDEPIDYCYHHRYVDTDLVQDHVLDYEPHELRDHQPDHHGHVVTVALMDL